MALSFDFTEEQNALRETARRYATEVIVPVAAKYDQSRDAKLMQIYEGPNQIQRVVIAKELLS